MQIKLSISASHRAAILESSGAPAEMVQKPAQDALRLRVGTIKSVQALLQNKAKIYSGSTIFIISHLIVSEVRAFLSLFELPSSARNPLSNHLLTKRPGNRSQY